MKLAEIKTRFRERNAREATRLSSLPMTTLVNLAYKFGYTQEAISSHPRVLAKAIVEAAENAAIMGIAASERFWRKSRFYQVRLEVVRQLVHSPAYTRILKINHLRRSENQKAIMDRVIALDAKTKAWVKVEEGVALEREVSSLVSRLRVSELRQERWFDVKEAKALKSAPGKEPMQALTREIAKHSNCHQNSQENAKGETKMDRKIATINGNTNGRTKANGGLRGVSAKTKAIENGNEFLLQLFEDQIAEMQNLEVRRINEEQIIGRNGSEVSTFSQN